MDPQKINALLMYQTCQTRPQRLLLAHHSLLWLLQRLTQSLLPDLQLTPRRHHHVDHDD